jgi:hypothetical protein
MKKVVLVSGLILLICLEIFSIYFIMPFPGSQKMDSLQFAYWLHNNSFWIRIILLVLVIFSFLNVLKQSGRFAKVGFSLLLVFYGILFYYTNFKFQADKIFHQPKSKMFADAASNTVEPYKLVLGVVNNGEAKAYPIQFIGYHHQVRDTVGGTPLIITYCTVCRTGRVFSPTVNGKEENFRLVGMDHFNAMFEDATTKSWWQQATGVAVAGKLKGRALVEIPSQQAKLGTWLANYPNSLVLQPDTNFNKRYKSLAKFDYGTDDDELEKRDSASWQFKSWVVGVDHKGNSTAYDWNMLYKDRMIEDSLPDTPLLVTLDNDTASFHVLNRKINNNVLRFSRLSDGLLTDAGTGSKWNVAGVCVDGVMKGVQLARIQASQEFWHSWQTFHPFTKKFKR